jgi:hypothetical protein
MLCDQELETAGHLCLHCVYKREVWDLVSTWSEGLIQVPTHLASVELWWNGSVQGRPKHLRKRVAALLMYTAWGLWKECNRQIFQGLVLNSSGSLQLDLGGMQLRVVAFSGRAGTIVS